MSIVEHVEGWDLGPCGIVYQVMGEEDTNVMAVTSPRQAVAKQTDTRPEMKTTTPVTPVTPVTSVAVTPVTAAAENNSSGNSSGNSVWGKKEKLQWKRSTTNSDIDRVVSDFDFRDQVNLNPQP